MAYYCASADVQQVFGTVNITGTGNYGDLDNDGDAVKIAARITYWIAVVQDKIHNVMRNAGYKLPLQDADGATPASVKDLAARMVGIELYEARGYMDVNPQTGKAMHRYGWMKMECRRTLEAWRTGDEKLDAIPG